MKNTRTQAPGFLRMLPFSSAPPAMLNYYIFAISMVVLSALSATGHIRPLHLASYAVGGFLAVLFTNAFLYCMVHGNCMKLSVAVVAALQAAFVALFLYFALQPPRLDTIV